MQENIKIELKKCIVGLEILRSEEKNSYRKARLHLALMALRRSLSHLKEKE